MVKIHPSCSFALVRVALNMKNYDASDEKKALQIRESVTISKANMYDLTDPLGGDIRFNNNNNNVYSYVSHRV